MAAGGKTGGPDNKRGQRGDSFPPWGSGGNAIYSTLFIKNSVV